VTLTHSRYCSAARVQRNPQPVIGFSRSLRSAILGQSFQPTGPLGVAEVVARVYQSGLGSLKANAVDDFQCAAPLARAPMTDEQIHTGVEAVIYIFVAAKRDGCSKLSSAEIAEAILRERYI
jgi:hypothetical protein